MTNPECLLYVSLQRGNVRMTLLCERPLVNSGSEKCQYFLGEVEPGDFALRGIDETDRAKIVKAFLTRGGMRFRVIKGGQFQRKQEWMY